MYFKSGQGDEAADSTIVRQGEATPYWFLLIHYNRERLSVYGNMIIKTNAVRRGADGIGLVFFLFAYQPNGEQGEGYGR
ncbi:hypothetical protein M0579_00296 [Neisseria meningitidis M0579]|nr:hypothetical protein M0579_00296 [Neisseria meningitidis M0579]